VRATFETEMVKVRKTKKGRPFADPASNTDAIQLISSIVCSPQQLPQRQERKMQSP
jgi:hypothetical protein